MDPDYEQRIASQIAQYSDTIDMHALPDIFHVWSHNYLASGMHHVFGTASIDDAYALAYVEARGQSPIGRGRILSVGCGDGEVEIRVAKALFARGIDDFTFVCADLSPILLERLREAVAREQMSSRFEPIEADLNRIEVPGRFDVIMANQSLHHIQDLEALYLYCHRSLVDRGIFVTCDMIGKNGHMRWPEAAAVIKALWPALHPKQRYHAQLQRYSEDFVDHDCSSEGFEGIRSQDVLPLLLDRFFPYKFFGAGGFIDLLVDRGYGHGYDANNEQDVKLIRFLADLNDLLLDSGVLKPTWMMGYFTKIRREERFFRNRTSRNAVRQKDDPAWTQFY